MADFSHVVIGQAVMSVELNLFSEFVELIRQELLFTQGSNEFYVQVADLCDVFFEVFARELVGKVKKKAGMIDVDVVFKKSMQIVPVLQTFERVGIVVADFDEDIVDIPSTVPDQLEAITVVDDHIISQAHSYRVQLTIFQQVGLESILSNLRQRN